MHNHNQSGRSRIPYVYILAASHSGSTLLAMLLNAHPEVVTVGELTSGRTHSLPLDGYLCSCRRLLRECAFWRRVQEAMSRKVPGFALNGLAIRFEIDRPAWVRRLSRMEHRGPLLEAIRDSLLTLSPAWRRLSRASMAACREMAGTLLELTGARTVVDSSKLAHRLKLVRRVRDLDVKVIHLVRDGRAVALTYMDPQRFADASDPAMRNGGGGTARGEAPRMVMTRAADEWRRSIVGAQHALAQLGPDRYLEVTYEDLSRTRSATLKRILDFVGLDATRLHPDFRAVEHHVLGNGMRLDSTADVVLDERWRQVLTADDLRDFEAVAGTVNRRYGYQ